MTRARARDEVDLVGLTELLRRRGHVRGQPVAISLFHDEIPDGYEGVEVEPCALVREAMDHERLAYVDAEHHSCLAGAWQAGFLEPPVEIRTGRYLVDNTPYFTERAAEIVKGGRNVLPLGTVRAIGAAPLDRVPDGVGIDWMVVVCEPLHAATIAGVRTSIDGVPPHGAAGTSLCGELFALPFHDRNVILTPGDMGGRMFNRVKPSEMFIIIPIEYAAHLFTILGERPDLTGLLDAIKPGYRAERDAKRAARAAIPWDDDALATLSAAPEEIREFAGPTLEAYAIEHGHERITMDVMREQMDSVGVRLEDLMDLADFEQDRTPRPSATTRAGSTRSARLAPERLHTVPRAAVRAAATVELRHPVEAVWDVLVDVRSWTEWYPDIRRIEAPATLVQGTRFRFRTGPTTVDATVDVAESLSALAFTGTSRGSTATYRFELDSASDQTATLIWLTQTADGLATRTMRPMLQRIADRSLPEWLDALAVRLSG